jgi:hypothetical protein
MEPSMNVVSAEETETPPPKALKGAIPLTHDLLHPGTKVTPPAERVTRVYTKRPYKTNAKKVPMTSQKKATATDQIIGSVTLRTLLNVYSPSKLSKVIYDKNNPAPIVHNIRDGDILFGRGNLIGQHPGNVFLRLVIARNQQNYVRLIREEKHLAADALLGWFESRGTRFLECISDGHGRRGGPFRYVSYTRAVEKFKQALREKILYRIGNAGMVGATPPVVANYSPLPGRLAHKQKHPLFKPPTKPAKSSTKLSSKSPGKTPVKSPGKTAAKSPGKTPVKSFVKAPPFKLITIPPLQVPATSRIDNPETVSSQFVSTLEIDSKQKTPVVAKKKKTVKPTIKAAKPAMNGMKPATYRAKPSIKKQVTSASSLKASKTPSSFSDVHEGDRLGIYWPLDKMYYPGTVRDISGQHAMVHYDDGEFEWVDLLSNKFFKWKEGVAKQLWPADVLKAPPMSTTTIPLKPPPGGGIQLQASSSIQTSASSGESSGDASPKPSTPGPFFVRGTFKPKPVSSKSLVSFLRKKLHASSTTKPAALC